MKKCSFKGCNKEVEEGEVHCTFHKYEKQQKRADLLGKLKGPLKVIGTFLAAALPALLKSMFSNKR